MELPVTQAPTRFDNNGQLVDTDIRERLTDVVNELITEAQERQAIQATA